MRLDRSDPLSERDAEPAVPQHPVELEVLYPGALGQGQAVVGGGHRETLLSGYVGKIINSLLVLSQAKTSVVGTICSGEPIAVG